MIATFTARVLIMSLLLYILFFRGRVTALTCKMHGRYTHDIRYLFLSWVYKRIHEQVNKVFLINYNSTTGKRILLHTHDGTAILHQNKAMRALLFCIPYLVDREEIFGCNIPHTDFPSGKKIFEMQI